jgi:alcohol dehydrogenase class IV
MAEDNSSFRFAYEPGTICYGPNSVDELAAELDRLDLHRALVACGQTVGETLAVIEPVTEGLGNRLASVFARKTPD